MPGRAWCVLIVLCWLGAGAWFLVRDAWPRLTPDEPPRFAIDLVDETQPIDRTRRTIRDVGWNLTHRRGDGPESRPSLSLSSSTTYHPEDDTFTLQARLGMATPGELKRWDSRYRVRRDGTILAYHAEVVLAPGEPALERQGAFHYVPDDRRLLLERNFYNPLKGWEWSRVQPRPRLPHSGLVQVPLHPVYRLDLPRPGRTWKVPFFDPVRDTREGESAVQMLEGAVRPEPVTIEFRGKEVRCLVLELRGEGVKGDLWAQADDGQLLRCEWTVGDDTWLITQGRDAPQGRPPGGRPGPIGAEGQP